MKQFGSFDVEAYQQRLRILRLVYGETQRAFSARVGIQWKLWNHYERGYPIPRETAFILQEKLQVLIAEWLWWGAEGNLTLGLRRRIRQVEREEARRIVDERKEQKKIAARAKKLVRKQQAQSRLSPG